MTSRHATRGHGSPALSWLIGLGAAVAAGLWLALGPAPAMLVFDRGAIAHGEVWRLVTGHFVHSDGRHALWDIGALAVIGHLAAGQGWRREAIAAGVGVAAVDACLWWGVPALELYCGLSGVLNTLFVVALAELWRCHRHRLFPAVAVLLGLKLVVEAVAGRSLILNADWPAVPLAHVAGAAGGLAFVTFEWAVRALRARRRWNAPGKG